MEEINKVNRSLSGCAKATLLCFFIFASATIYLLYSSPLTSSHRASGPILDKRSVPWQVWVAGGVAAVAVGVLSTATWILKEYCLTTLLAAVGIVPVAGEADVTACVGVAAVAISTSGLLVLLVLLAGTIIAGSSTLTNAVKL